MEDPTGKLTIDDINSPKWASKFKRCKDKVPNFGFSKSTFWARVKIKNKTSDQRVWVLSQNYNRQNYVTLYKKVNESWESFSTGDLTPFKTREIQGREFSFKIKPKENTLYFIRIKGSYSKLHLTISSLQSLMQKKTIDNLISGLFFGLVISVALYNLFIFLSTKSLSYLFYILYVVFWGIFLFIKQGLSQRFLAPDSLWISNKGIVFFGAFGLFFLVLFTISFLRLKESTPKLYRGCQCLAFLYFLLITGSFIFAYTLSAKLFMFTTSFLGIPLITFCGIYRVKMDYRPAKYLLFAFSSVFLGGIVAILMTFGLLPTNILTNQAISIGVALELTILSMGLADRFNLIQEENLKLQKNYAKDLESEVDQKTKKIKSLVENLGQGFMVMDKKGIILEGATQITKDFFSIDSVGKNLSRVLKLDEEKTDTFNKWIQNVYRGILPFKDLEMLGPQSFNLDNRHIDLNYRPIYVEGSKRKIDKVICIATDKTQEINLEKQLELDKQQALFIKNCLQNPVEFVDLMDDTYDLLEHYPKIKNNENGGLFRHFHTLKARYGQFGVKDLTYYLNEVETALSKKKLDSLDSKVNHFKRELEEFVKENRLIIEAANKFMIDDGTAVEVSEILKVLGRLKTKHRKNPAPAIGEAFSYFYENSYLKDIKSKFDRYRYLINELAEKQGKGIDHSIGGDEIKVDINKYSSFINSSIHLFRNMVDHGIETEEERIEKTKPQRGRIKVDFNNNGDTFMIQMVDDGGGIDPERIKNKVPEAGLKSEEDLKELKESDIVDLIFLPGFSTKEEVTDVSGQGVGMDAVREEVERLGGSISVTSKIDEGTTFMIQLPVLS